MIPPRVCREVAFYAITVEPAIDAYRALPAIQGVSRTLLELILDPLLTVRSAFANKTMETIEAIDPLVLGRTHPVFETGEKHGDALMN
jgi:hypothetical protein